jgi:hypothetical protein
LLPHQLGVAGIREFHSTMACSDDVISFLRSPSVGHTRGREREVEEGVAHKEERRAQGTCCCVCLPPPGPPLYSGEGGAPTPPPRQPRAAAKEERRRPRWSQAGPHPNHNPSPDRLGPKGPWCPFPLSNRGAHMALVPFGRGPLRWVDLF